jgi:hypothetical protein
MRRQIIDVSRLKLHPSQERRQRRLKAIRIAAEREKSAESQDSERVEPWRYTADDPVDST